ncbi:MAG: DUF1365 domain-containing protein [Opitutaceae bacterium]|jgi:uncharacterized protein|nr:DUF1365 domain-containing protein [Opitutaceae bacterium]|tara:strand:- start:5074 stop:5931 length:858 start_codon:yes stop_codon:yes gene_type:complete
MNSRLFECRILHDRFIPRRHRFLYRVFMLAVDLDELDLVAKNSRLLRINRGGMFSFRESDFLKTNEEVHNPSEVAPAVPRADESVPLKKRVIDFLQSRGVSDEVTRIELITMPRVAGYLFNPVAFYFCYDTEDRPVAAISEVTNTFGEMKPFLIDRTCCESGVFRLRVPKHFYVSPFSDVDVEFDFKLRPVGEKLALQIDDHADGKRTLMTVLTGNARPLRDTTLLWFTVKYPLLTLKVITAIHWQAFLLYLKKIPWFAKAARSADQRDLFQPHQSLNARPHSES